MSRSRRSMTVSTMRDGDGRMMLRMPSPRTASSHPASIIRLIATGQATSISFFRALLSMTGLDGFAQLADVGVEWLALHDRDVARTREKDLDFFDNGRGAA